jgi:hypothetical protein
MPRSPPPVAHTGMKKPPTAAYELGATLPTAADLVEGTAASMNHAATNTNGGTLQLQGKTFVQKIQALLDVPDYSSIISWNDVGNVVIIHDVDAFISTIIPVYFKKSKFGSFIRRMRRWGFSVITKKRSLSTSSTSSERGQITVVEFSSEHFLRDQPDLCLLMKDERQVKKKKINFLDRNIRKIDGGLESNNQGSSVGVCVPHPSSSSLSNMNTAKNQPESHHQLKVPSVDGGFNSAVNDAYPHNYSQENSMTSMISPNMHSFHSAMPMTNMMSPHPPQLPYPPYGYGAPPPPPGLDFGPVPDGFPPYPHQQQQQQQQHMMQRNQQQNLQQQYYQIMQQNQQYPPPAYAVNRAAVSGKKEATTDAAASATPNGNADAKASTASINAALLSSSSEETTELDLLPNTTVHPIVRIHPQFDTERNGV